MDTIKARRLPIVLDKSKSRIRQRDQEAKAAQSKLTRIETIYKQLVLDPDLFSLVSSLSQERGYGILPSPQQLVSN